MKLDVFIANAFSGKKFGGNPAAVVPLEKWLDEALMQQIAEQNRLPETAFVVPEENDFGIRWFTPSVEVDLCGHATLAAAYVMFRHLNYPGDEIIFHSKVGPLKVKRKQDLITLDFPVINLEETKDDGRIEKALGKKVKKVFISRFDFMAVLDSQNDIESLDPDLTLIKELDARGLIVTAKGNESDFVSRCFFPQSGIDEDPVTGSAHCAMMAYWSKELGSNKLSAIQLSARKGYLDCELVGDRVLMSGYANTYLRGEFYV
jgi:PhzF family phenazine biosynthesis protein